MPDFTKWPPLPLYPDKLESPGVLEEDLQRMAEQRRAHMARRIFDESPEFNPGALNRIEAKLDQLLELHGRPQSVIILADPQIDRIAAELKKPVVK